MRKRAGNRPREQYAQPIDKKGEPAEEKNSADIDVPITSKSTPTNKNTDCPHQRWYKRIPWWKLIEAVGVVAVVVYALITYLQWQDLGTNFRLDQRAWVGLNGTVIIDSVETSTTPEPQVKVSAHFLAKNFGHGPAFNISQISRFWTDGYPTDYLAHNMCNGAIRFTQGELGVNGSSNTLFPDQQSGFDIGTPTDPQPGKAPNPGDYWGFVGCVAYIDQFRTIHWTRFCMEPYDRSAAITKDARLRFCVKYNDTDDQPK